MPSAHASVKHELLVRYLDAWTPAALHGHKRVTYVDQSSDGDSCAAAFKVFCEFADLLERHTLTMMVVGAWSLPAERPPGLVVRTVPDADSLVPALKDAKALGSPIFGWFDSSPLASPSAPLPLSAVAAVAGNKASEVMLVVSSPAVVESLHGAGLRLTCRVELVDEAGQAELLVFATSSEKALEKFKDELWALDEYAGIRLREPLDEERTLLDISVQPHLGPLRRALLARVVHTGGSTVAELRTWAVRETVFRAADATKAVQSLVASSAVERVPTGGRVSATTMIQPVAQS